MYFFMKGEKKKRGFKELVWIAIRLSLVLLLGYIAMSKLRTFSYASAEDLVRKNYSAEVKKICETEKLPAAYFNALIILECSGRKPSGSRFEPHVYDKLLAVKEGRSKSYMNISSKRLENMDESTLKQLATSWGPLQLMGYHCLTLGISIDELKGPNTLKHSIRWCKKNYGKYLDKKDFKNAFHLHNTGRTHPEWWFSRTHDPDYVQKGLGYMDRF
ncbi:MAG: hypothetical protein EAZ57_05105 [Cytophagales bacterium]|nr:MAG: hypothetical protein EAZ67_06475 [Cytophagales bacterium]TAF60930.1 MAG: hypothetical protein EAZ57_05105 [Cytophagales bacterium]